MRYFLLFGFLSVMFSTGCVRDIGPASQKLSIRRVQVEPRVEVERPLRFGYDPNSDDLAAQLTASLDDGLQAKRMAAFQAIMATNEINVSVLVRERAAALLRDVKKLEVTTNAADATFVAVVEQYGFGGVGFKNSRYIPFMVLRGQLQDRTGKVVWSSRGRTHPIVHDDVSATIDVYAARPELLRQHWEHQIERTLKKMLAGQKYDATHLLFGADPPPPSPVRRASR